MPHYYINIPPDCKAQLGLAQPGCRIAGLYVDKLSEYLAVVIHTNDSVYVAKTNDLEKMDQFVSSVADSQSADIIIVTSPSMRVKAERRQAAWSKRFSPVNLEIVGAKKPSKDNMYINRPNYLQNITRKIIIHHPLEAENLAELEIQSIDDAKGKLLKMVSSSRMMSDQLQELDLTALDNANNATIQQRTDAETKQAWYQQSKQAHEQGLIQFRSESDRVAKMQFSLALYYLILSRTESCKHLATVLFNLAVTCYQLQTDNKNAVFYVTVAGEICDNDAALRDSKLPHRLSRLSAKLHRRQPQQCTEKSASLSPR